MLAEDEILARELGRLGGIGARLVARLLATNVGEREVTLLAGAEQVRAAVRQVFASHIEDERDDSIRVRVGAGKMNLNPALITFRLTAGPGSGTTVRVRGAAKEGWLKQRAGEQAADRAVEWLSATFQTVLPAQGSSRDP